MGCTLPHGEVGKPTSAVGIASPKAVPRRGGVRRQRAVGAGADYPGLLEGSCRDAIAALADLPAGSEPETILDNLGWAYPRSTIVLTLGEKGVLCRANGGNNVQKAFPVSAVDTTAAGDTFTGYFLAGLCQGKDLGVCLKEAAAAAALAVSRPGAAPSIPTREEVEEFLKK